MNELAELYRYAAEFVDSGKCDYSCWAILDAWRAVREEPDVQYPPRALLGFQDRFADSDSGHLSSMNANREWGRKGRVIALIFAAAMAEAGDL